MAQPVIQPSFGAGELSPSLFGRVDLAKFHSGAALLRNFFVDYRGGVSNRTGSLFIGDSTDASLPTRLVRFIFSTLQAYALVFDHRKMRVIMNGALVQAAAGGDYTISTPYDAVDLALLKFTQSADVLTICHPSYAPRELTRTAHDAWTLSAISFVSTVAIPTAVSAVPSMTGDSTDYTYVVTAVASNGLTESLPSDAAKAVNSKIMSATSGANQKISWTAVPGAQFYNIYRQPEVANGSATSGQIFGFVGTSTTAEFVDANIAPDFTRTPPQGNNPFTSAGSGYVNALFVSPGSQYQLQPAIASSGGGGTGFAAHAGLTLLNCSVEGSFGTGYTLGDILTFVGGAGTRPAQVRVIAVANSPPLVVGWITALSVIDGGDYTTLPGHAAGFGTGGTSVTGGTGTGALLGGIWGVGSATIDNAGNNYTTAPDLLVVGGGPFAVGASVMATIAGQVINSPGCTTYFQQRQVFAASLGLPQTFWMSKTGDYHNFGYSSPSRPDDSITGTIASQEVNAIKHLVPLGSLLALSSSGAWKIDAGNQGGTVTPQQIEANPQAYNGCSDVPPIVVNYDVLYVQSKGSIVRDLSYNFYANIYTGTDMTSLANHLFFGHQIVEWCYAEEPFKLIYAIREDGILLTFTFLKEQEVYAWAHHDTKGRYKSICTIPEGTEDAIYAVVERYVQGAKHQYIERFASRNMGAIPEEGVPADLARAWFVDCGLQYPLTYPHARCTPSETTATYSVASIDVVDGGTGYSPTPSIVVTDETGYGVVLSATVVGGVITAITVGSPGANLTNPTITIVDPTGTGAIAAAELARIVDMTLSSIVSESTAVGDTIRVNNGYGVVLSKASASGIVTLRVNLQHDLTSTWPAESGAWSCTTPVLAVSGLDHLEGEYVAILADGNVLPQQQVVGGRVTLEQAATAIFAGLPYRSQLKSLYLDIPGEQPTVQGKRKKISAVTVRVQDSRGLAVGHTFDPDDMKEIKEREFELMGQPILPITGDERVVVDPLWDVPGQICVEQQNPLPCTILALLPEVSIGDTVQ